MAKRKLAKKILEYTAVFEPAEMGGYVVSVPSLPGCVTQGETFEEASRMIKDAIGGYLEVLRETKNHVVYENPGVVISKVSIASPAF
ncbi:MAG: type II toxin-antitoxin system HicB family antitoxin [Patescibacteria group bacterium]